MKQKYYLAIVTLFLSIGYGIAQAPNPECTTKLSIYFEHAKVKNYDAAYEPWKTVYDACPGIHRANFSYGERILKHKIKNSSGAEKDGYIQDLLALYDASRTHFADKFPVADVTIDKVLLQKDHNMISEDATYDMLGSAFDTDLKNFTNPKALYLYFSTLVDLHNGGKKELGEVFNVYDKVTEKITVENKKLTDNIKELLPKEEAGTLTSKEKKRFKAANTNSESFGKIASSIDSKLGGLADCNNLIPLYQKNFDAKKNDVNWVKSAVGRMFNKDCTDDPMFKKLFEAQLALDPSADAFVYGGTLKQKAGDRQGAIADFNKAVELETDSYKRSNILYKIATTLRRSSKSQARNYAQKAVDANPANGKAYLLIASLYASSANDCGSNAFEKRAIYWKAAETARKAGRVDPSLKSRANKSVASYSAKAPTKEMIFSSAMGGKTVTFSCWVGGSVKVPNL